jgi:preprotein translocase subunit SecA
MSFLRALLDGNEREVAKLRKIVAVINDHEAEMQALSNEGLRAKTEEFRERLKPFSERIDEARAGRSEAIDPAAKAAVEAQVKVAYEALEAELMDVLPEAFAVVREASRRTLHMRHYDVQMMAGTVLHMGRVAELATGEGKTLAATSPLYLNALTGKPAHLVTTNDYLAKRDATWMAPIFSLLGLTIGVIQGASAQHPHGSAWLYTPGYSEDDPAMQDLKFVHRAECYQCDLIYGTNAEFGFDYLRDNMARDSSELVQSDLHFAIVDEMDSILIDEARTPLIISGMPEQTSELYYRVDRVVARLEKERDYTVDEKAKNAMTTDEGIRRIEEGLGVSNLADDVVLMHHVNAALRARYAYRKDIEYVVKDGQVIIVDEYTGRLMFGRRYSDGLHQAIEAKEGVKVEEETQTVATITIQNYFRLYHKLAGMTGTAKTEEQEIRKIYGMDVVVVPTNLPMIRADLSDVVYKTEEQKFRAIVLEVLGKHVKGQPVLLGTRSIETSERLSERIGIGERLQLQALILLLREKLVTTKGLPKEEVEQAHALLNTKLEDLFIDKLKPVAKLAKLPLDALDEGNIRYLKDILGLETDATGDELLHNALEHGIPHSVLNAKYHEREGQIIADAGRKHAITIATNMAGRGVDIMLGGHRDMDDPEEPTQVTLSSGVTKIYPTPQSAEVAQLGGLAIVGSERHESRRIDRQLRGRSGRQGDPGESRFFLSLEDELWRLFGDRGRAFLGGWQEWEPLEARILTGAIQRAQKKVEEHHFGQRKNTLEYDDVMNVHRDVIYKQRKEILEGADLRDTILDHTFDMIEVAVGRHCGAEIPQHEWDLRGLYDEMDLLFDLALQAKPAELEGQTQEQLVDFLFARAEKRYEQKEAEFEEAGVEIRDAERHIALQVIDQKWIEHLNAMDYLREGVWMRGFEQRDPLVIYKKEAFDMFNSLLNSIQDDMVNWMFHLVLRREPAPPPRRTLFTPVEEDDTVGAPLTSEPNGNGQRRPAGVGGAAARVGRNDPCPCGSGKKYKFCCLKTGAL